jgi:hypothetical protein
MLVEHIFRTLGGRKEGRKKGRKENKSLFQLSLMKMMLNRIVLLQFFNLYPFLALSMKVKALPICKQRSFTIKQKYQTLYQRILKVDQASSDNRSRGLCSGFVPN